MPSVKFDNVEICTGIYVPSNLFHESVPEKHLSLLDLAREDGAVYINSKYGTKRIIIRGTLIKSSQSDLESAIDSFKELFSRPQKNLDISWASGTRRYVATCVRHNFNREFMHMNICPWVAEFVVPSGIGTDTSETQVVNNQSFTAVQYSGSVNLEGSAEPKPRIRVKCGVNASDVQGVSIIGPKGGKMVIIREGGMQAGRYFEFDLLNKRALYDGNEVAFHGSLPIFEIGSNAYTIKCGEIVDQEHTTGVLYTSKIYGNNYFAQSFMVPERDTTYRIFKLWVRSIGSPPQLRLSIRPDAGGKPDMSQYVKDNNNLDCSITVSPGSSFGWVEWDFSNGVTLEANTKYWLVVSCSTGDASNYHEWQYTSGVDSTYARGNGMSSTDGGSNWTNHSDRDYLFRVCYGGAEDGTKTYYFDIFYYKRYL